MTAGDVVRVTAYCGLDWTGPRQAWTGWISDRHAHAHNKCRDGLPASCDGLTVTLVEPDPQGNEHDQDWAGPGFTRPGPEPALEDRGGGRPAEADAGMNPGCVKPSAESMLDSRSGHLSETSGTFYRGHDEVALTYTREAPGLEAGG
jgi:hypothetical protein